MEGQLFGEGWDLGGCGSCSSPRPRRSPVLLLPFGTSLTGPLVYCSARDWSSVQYRLPPDGPRPNRDPLDFQSLLVSGRTPDLKEYVFDPVPHLPSSLLNLVYCGSRRSKSLTNCRGRGLSFLTLILDGDQLTH